MAGFRSTVLGRNIDVDDLADITSYEQASDLWFEVGKALSELNAQLLQTPRHINKAPNRDYERLTRTRAFLAPFHQRVAHRKSQLRDAAATPRAVVPIRGESPHSDAIAGAPTVEAIYLQVARQELDPAVHQRLLLIAEQRRHTEVAMRTGLAMGG